MNLELNKDKYHSKCTSVPFFGDVISIHGLQTNPRMPKVLIEMPPPKTKEELQTFLRIINYLGKFPPSTADAYESLGRITLDKTGWIWNAAQQKMFNKAKAIIMYKILL